MQFDTIQTLIKDYQTSQLREFTSRDLKIPQLADMSVSVVGARRCGKSYRTHQLVKDLCAKGVKRESICRIQFNDHRFSKLSSNDLSIIDMAYYSMYPEFKRGDAETWFIFDEIQRINGWEDYILALLETPTHHIILTGSTSKLLRGDIATGLRGKNFALELLPFSFVEFIRHYRVDNDQVTSNGKALLRNYTEKYLNQGGFPGLLNLEHYMHVDMLQSYWDTMVIRDIAENHPHEEINITSLVRFGQFLGEHIGCPITIRSIAESLRATGIKTSPDTLHKYSDYFAEAFMLFTIPIFSQSEAVRNRNYRKVYAIDWALGDSISQGGTIGISRKLENAVFIELKRRGFNVSYYKTRKGYEIDFIASSKNNRSSKPEIYQVCYNVDSAETLDREIRGIPETAAFLGTDQASIITMDTEKEITVDKCKIRIIPAWKWFLES